MSGGVGGETDLELNLNLPTVEGTDAPDPGAPKVEPAKPNNSPNKISTLDKRNTTTPRAVEFQDDLETAQSLMFPAAFRQHRFSLMPASQFTQKKVGVMAWAADIVHHYRAANFTGVIDDDVAKSH